MVVLADDGGETAWEIVAPAFESLVDEPVDVVEEGEPASWDGVLARVVTGASFAAEPTSAAEVGPEAVPTVVVDLGESRESIGAAIEDPSVVYLRADMPAVELQEVLTSQLPARVARSETENDGPSELLGLAADSRMTHGGARSLDRSRLARAAFERGPTATVVAEAESGTIVAVNDAAIDLFGRSRASLRGADQRELHPPDERQRYRTGFESAIEEGGGSVSVGADDLVEIQGADGEQIPVNIESEVIEVRGKRYLVGTFVRGTETRERIKTLNQQATAMDASLTGISILDESGAYVYMNDAHADIIGYPPEELLGGSWRQLYDEQTVEYIEAEVFPVLETTGGWEGELVGRGPDGEPAYQHVSLTSLPDGGLVCVNQDISRRKRVERQLRAIRERVETFMLADGHEEIVEELLAASAEVLDRSQAGYWARGRDSDRLEPVSITGDAAALNVETPTFKRGEGLIWRAYEAGELRYYPDVRTQDDVYNAETPIVSEVIVPVGDHGVMMVSSEQVDDFEPAELELLQILSSHAETAFDLVEREAQLAAAHDAVEAERRQLRTIIDQVPHLIFAKTAEGEFIFANEAVAKAYGTEPEQLEGRTDAEFAEREAEAEDFREDDRRVIEQGMTVRRQEEVLTDVEGNERLLNTVKIPFEPTGYDERAVLGVATDVTEYRRAQMALERQRKLTGLNRVGRLLLDAKSEEAVAETGVAATAEALDAAQVGLYRFEPGENRLVRTATAREETVSPGVATVTPDGGSLWAAFATREARQEVFRTGANENTQHGHVPNGDERSPGTYQRIVIPLDEFGLLIVVVAPDADPDMEFIETAGKNITAAIKRTRHETQLEDLNRQLRERNDELRESQNFAEAFREATRRLREASNQAAVHEALAAFGRTVGDEVWVGHWHAGTQHVDPVFDTSTNGLARPQGGTEATDDTGITVSPMLTAIHTDDLQIVENTLSDVKYEAWTGRLVNFGYQSVVAAPISRGALVYGGLEVVSTSPSAFGQEACAYLTELCRSAAERLEAMQDAPESGQSTELDFELPTERLFFPEVPEGWRIDGTELFFSSRETVRVEATLDGTTIEAAESYFRTWPHFTTAEVTSLESDTLSVTVDIVGVDDTVETLWEFADARDLTLTAVVADPESEVVSLRVPSSRIREIKSALEELVENVRLLTKRVGTTDVTASRRASPLDELTDRQREVVSTAYRLGFYTQPKGVSGDDLAERFDISRSTVHQHLRKAEGKLLQSLLEN